MNNYVWSLRGEWKVRLFFPSGKEMLIDNNEYNAALSVIQQCGFIVKEIQPILNA